MDDAKQIRNRILQAARNAYETSQRRPAGEKLADIEVICDDLAAWAYALGYNAARDDTLTRELARSPRWDDQPSIPAEGAEQ